MKKYYLKPSMKFHELKSGQIMAASLGQADTTQTPNDSKKGVEDFEENNNIW